MRLRLINLMELVAGLALGLGFARFDYTEGVVFAEPTIMYGNDLLLDVLAGFAVAAGVGLGVECLVTRGMSRPWGGGRWIWGIAAMSFFLGGMAELALIALDQYLEYNRIEFMHFLVTVSFAVAVNSATSDFVDFLLVFLLCGLLSRRPRGGPADYREWSGRVFGGVLIGWRAVVYVYGLLHPDDWRIH